MSQTHVHDADACAGISSPRHSRSSFPRHNTEYNSQDNADTTEDKDKPTGNEPLTTDSAISYTDPDIMDFPNDNDISLHPRKS